LRLTIEVDVQILFSEDPSLVLDEAGEFLASDPVLHNLILTLLDQRVKHPQPGRYWLARKGDAICGVAFQSPLNFYATITPMPFDVLTAVVDAIVDGGVTLPGVSGAVAPAAQFAGQWTERTKSAAVPLQGQRLYEAREVEKPKGVNGRLRTAGMQDRDLILNWIFAFHDDIGQYGMDPTANVDQRLPAGMYRLWEDGEPVSMAGYVGPVEGVARIGAVYTPREKRRRGYGGACVSGLTEQLLERGLRPILYTDLGNPVSNSIYRRMGYRAVAEVLVYKFE
jgi:GNAT superfamily N-acetyltransferase